jgi:hypothetical protein
MADDSLSPVEVRLECLRIAVEFGTQRDMLNPEQLVDKYYQLVTQGSDANRPVDNRKDDRRKQS